MRRAPRWARKALTPLALVAAWQLAAARGWLPSRTLSSPAEIASSAWELTRSGALPLHLAASLRRVAAGGLVGGGLGLAAGIAAGLSRLGEDLLDATIQMLRTLPHLGLVPLLLLWLGIGDAPKVTLVALGMFFPLYLNVFAGIRSVDEKLVEVARICGLGRAALVWHVVLPGALPSTLVGLRYALGVGWLSLVVGEQVNASSGIGYLMMDAREFNRVDVMLVGLSVYALLGLGTDLLVRRIERGALAWRRAFAGA